MDSASQRRCPQCDMPVAQRADTCLLCGAHLRERPAWEGRLPHSSDLLLPLAAVAVLFLLWLWKPWQARSAELAAAPTATDTLTVTASATLAIAPTATPLESATPTVTPTLPPNQTTHTVKSGETVSSIAKLYGTTTSAILQANGLKSNSRIRPGQTLKIPFLAANTPTPTATPLPTPTPVVYVVRSGDTLSEIAKAFGTTVESLMQANGITGATGVRAGTRLVIPPAISTPAPPAYTTYEVRSGDTLSGIAARYKTTVSDIKLLNGLTDSNIKAGQKLKIPSGPVILLPTAAPSETPLPPETPTPRPALPYSAPALLGPANEAVFEGPEAIILMSWASVGILGEDEWYVIRLHRSGPITEQMPAVWTRVTSWRLPVEVYIADLPEAQRFSWQAVVMHKTGEDADGTWLGEEISLRGTARKFSWK